MDHEFIAILQQLIAEQGKEALLTHSKCKPLLADYAKNDYKKECRLLLQAVDAGAAKAINDTQELELCKKQQVRVLQEEHFLAAEAATDIVDTLALVLRGQQASAASNICSNCGKELQKEWHSCPFCSTPVVKTQKKQPANSNPQDAQSYYDKGESYYENDDFDNAITQFNEAIRLDPNFAVAYNSRGNSYDANDEYDAAIKDYSEAIRLNPNSAVFYYNRGDSYRKKGEYDNAIKDYTEAIRLDPSDAAFYYYLRGNSYRMKGEYDNAIKDFNEAIRINPWYANAYAGRGFAYNKLGQRNKAIRDLKKAINLDPNNEWAKELLENIQSS